MDSAQPILKRISLHQLKNDPEYYGWRTASNQELEALLNSVRADGIVVKLVVTEQPDGSFLIIDGHRRVQVAKELGIHELWCEIFPPMSQAEVLVKRFRLNKPSKRHRDANRIPSATSDGTGAQ